MWTSYFVDMSPEEATRTLAAKAWRLLELSSEHARQLLERGDPLATGQRFREFAQGEGARLPQGHLWLHVDVAGDDQADVIDRLRGWLDLFVGIGIEAAVIHPGAKELKKAGAPPERVLERRVRGFRALIDHIADAPMSLCLENTPSTNTLVEIRAIIDAVASPRMALCLDTGHLNMADGDQGKFIRGAGQLLRALHIADNEGQTDQHIMPYGKGTVPWPAVVSALKEIDYNGLFNLEIGGERRCPLPIALAKLDYIKAMVTLMLNDETEPTP